MCLGVRKREQKECGKCKRLCERCVIQAVFFVISNRMGAKDEECLFERERERTNGWVFARICAKKRKRAHGANMH